MKGLGYIFAAMAVFCIGAAFFGHPHQFLTGAIAGVMAYAILSSEDDDDENNLQPR